jgi:hypothetical protein
MQFIEVKPFGTPNFVLSKEQGRFSLHLKELDEQALSDLCDKFRQDVFKKANKKDPRGEK